MKTLKKLCWALLVFLALPLQGCALSNSGAAIDGQVVGAETHQPLEGVNVVADWEMHWHGFNGGDTVVKLLETVTDKDGRYHLPAWGPEPIPSYVPWDASQNPVYPRIVFFKSGYYTNEVSNDDLFRGGIPRAWTTKSQWNGKTIGLKKFKGSLKEYSSQVEFFLGLAGADAQCVLKSQVPRAVAVGIKEGERLTQLGIRNALPRLRDIDESGDPACEALKKSIREYLK